MRAADHWQVIAGDKALWGMSDGSAEDARFCGLQGLLYCTYQHKPCVYGVDSLNHRIVRIALDSGHVTTVVCAAQSSSDAETIDVYGAQLSSLLHNPHSMVLDTASLIPNTAMFVTALHGVRHLQLPYGSCCGAPSNLTLRPCSLVLQMQGACLCMCFSRLWVEPALHSSETYG